MTRHPTPPPIQTPCCYNQACPVARNERRLVAISGEDGRNGRLADMRKDIEDNKKANKTTDEKVTKLELRGNLVPAGTAGAVVAIAELLSRVL